MPGNKGRKDDVFFNLVGILYGIHLLIKDHGLLERAFFGPTWQWVIVALGLVPEQFDRNARTVRSTFSPNRWRLIVRTMV